MNAINYFNAINPKRHALILLILGTLVLVGRPHAVNAAKIPETALWAPEENKGFVSLEFKSEVALAILHGPRTSGGNEASLGDLYVNLVATFEREVRRGSVGTVLDIVPEDVVLNFKVPDEINEYNHNRFRADGFLSRPYLLGHIYYELEPVSLRLGAMKFAGLAPLEGFPTAYYAAQLSPLILSQHYDKGIRIDLSYSEWLIIQAGLIDGDWEMGEPDIFAMHDSRANSYPGVTARLTLKFKGFKLDGSFIKNGVGSNGGEKTYSNHRFIALGYDIPKLEIRGFYGELERGPTWGPLYQPNWPPEETLTYGLELALRNIAESSVDLYAGWSKMWRESGDPAGTIWVEEETSIEKQWVVGAQWQNPFGLDIVSLNLSFGDRDMNGLEQWRIIKNKSQTFFLGVEFDCRLL